jgi:hypothetical protein
MCFGGCSNCISLMIKAGLTDIFGLQIIKLVPMFPSPDLHDVKHTMNLLWKSERSKS